MTRRTTGCVTRLDNGSWFVRVSCGYRSDGKRRVVRKTVHGTYDDACLEAARIKFDMSTGNVGDSLTLREYYSIFRTKNSTRGKPRAQSTLYAYDSQMRRNVLPYIGDRPISAITHAEMKRVIMQCKTQARCKEVLRAVMLSAYDDGLIDDKPFQRRIATPRKHRQQTAPWDAQEAIEAISALTGYRRPEIEAYMILGLSGLRTEECLGALRRDVQPRETFDLSTMSTVRTMVVAVHATYTYHDGFREGTKTDFSTREVPVAVWGRERLLRIVAASMPEDRADIPDWSEGRIVDLTYNQLLHAWRRALAENGIRYIPPDMLRHTSETLMQQAGIQDTLVSRLHGHESLRTDYKNYMRPGLSSAEGAARAVHKIMLESEQLGTDVLSSAKKHVYAERKKASPPAERPFDAMVGDEGLEPPALCV